MANIHLTQGKITNEKDAAMAYDEAARKLFGEFARTNFPKERTGVLLRI